MQIAIHVLPFREVREGLGMIVVDQSDAMLLHFEILATPSLIPRPPPSFLSLAVRNGAKQHFGFQYVRLILVQF